MKNLIVNKITAIFLTLIIVFGLIPSVGFAQPNPPSPLNEVKGFNISVFDSHFSRADREITPERWLAEAKIGITQAVYAWEMIASGMYENPFVFEEAKAKLEDWSGKELEARFSQWLIKRFFGETLGKAVSDFSTGIGETQKKYTWHLDDEGNVAFDEKTGDPLVIRPGEEGREFLMDRAIWRNEAEGLVEKNGGSFDAVLISMYPELLAYVPAELRETMSAAINKAGTAASAGIKREFENIAAREQRIFTSRRTRDIWSLRKQSDDEAARVFTEKLIADTEQVCSRGIEDLNSKIEQAYAGTGDLALLGEEWLQLYKEQFDRGLKAWEEAEERFFIRRIEWEQDSINLYSEGEKIWFDAFDKLNEEYQKWELKAKELFDSGEQLFKNISETLEKNIASAKNEFEINKNMRVGTGAEKVKALIDMYITGASAAISAKENVQYWLSRYNSGKKVDDPGISEWLLNERKKYWIQYENNYKQSVEYKTSLEKLTNLKTAISEIENKEFTTEETSTDNVLLISENNENISDNIKKSAEEKAARERAAQEKAELLKKAKDDYENYLVDFNIEHQLLFKIQDFSSGKMTFNEEMAFAEEIKEKKYFYADNLYRLFDIQKYYNLYSSYLETALDARDKILVDYAEIIGTGALKDVLSPDASTEDFYLDEYQLALVKAKTLVLYWERKTSIAQAVISYSEKIDAGRMTEAESIQAWENAKTAYNNSLALYETELNKLSKIGDDIHNQKNKLADLEKKMSEEEELLFKLSREHSMLVASSYANIKVIAEDDIKNRYTSLVEEYKYFLKTGDNASYKDILEYGKNWSIAQQREDAEKMLYMLIEEECPEDDVLYRIRLAAIDLLADGPYFNIRDINSTYSGADWYSKAKGIVLSDEEKSTLYGDKLTGRLLDDLNKSHITLIKKRLNYELNKMKKILDIDTESENYKEKQIIAMKELKYKELSLEDVAYIYNILLNLNERVDTKKDLFTEDNDENNVINFFLFENTFCEGTEKNLLDYYNDYYFCSNLYDLYINYASLSSFWEKENRQNIFNNINSLLAGYGFDTKENVFPDALGIYNAILGKEGEFPKNIYLFFNEFQKCFSSAPKWLENEFYFWENAVIGYIDADYSSSEINDDNDKHWRQYITEVLKDEIDPVLTGCSASKEGITEDALFIAACYTNRLNDALSLFLITDSPELTQTSRTLFNIFSDKSSDFDNRMSSLNYYYYEISNLGRMLDISKLSSEKAKEESNIVYNSLKNQEKIFNTAKENYFLEAENFLNIGNLYNEQYSAVKKAYEDTENKRFEYEKEDAIRRWASTAYLDADTVNIDDCKSKLEKAQIALNILLETRNEKVVFDNPEYNVLYQEYKQSFTNKIKALDALEDVSKTLALEYKKNESYFNNYKDYLLQFAALTPLQQENNPIEFINNWVYKDYITVKDGRLAFSTVSLSIIDKFLVNFSDNSYLQWEVINNPDKEKLENFFNSSIQIKNGRHEISLFEEALSGLSQRIAAYFKDPEKIKQWGLAREYLVYSLSKSNPDLEYLSEYVTGLGYLGEKKSLGSVNYDPGILNPMYNLYDWSYGKDIENIEIGRSVYQAFSEKEKADLEFYIILTLSGGGYSSGFSEIVSLDMYQEAYDHVKDHYEYALRQNKKLLSFNFYKNMIATNYSALGRIEPVLNKTKEKVDKFISGVKNNSYFIQNYYNYYLSSCNNINILNGEKEAGKSVVWDDIDKALKVTNTFNSDDINTIKSCWEKMQKTSFTSFKNINEALSGLILWTKTEESRIKYDFEKIRTENAQNMQINENNYFTAWENYVSGNGNINDLKTAAEKAYGKKAAMQKNQLDNIFSVLINDLSLYSTEKNDHYSEFASIGRDIELLFEKSMENRYAAELAAREIEWAQMRKDISAKAGEWQNSVSIILETGRAEWSAGKQKMSESYKQWSINFQNEVKRIENEWAQAYLTGLEDKEIWLEKAEYAFNQASAESFLHLVGTEGERLSKFMDTREPFGIRNALPEAQAIMSELINSSGIVNMAAAFGSMNNIASSSSIVVKSGLGGVSSWDSAVVKTAAKDMAVKTNAALADAESRKIAHSASLTISDAINKLSSNVKDANKNFRESMDNQFIMEGLWRINGKNYEKDIIKGSTLFQSVISEKKTIAGYNDYKMESVSLKTNMDEEILLQLNTIAIRALINSAYEEVKSIAEDIFVKETNNEPLSKDRKRSPGKFGEHIGYQPDVKPSNEFGKTKESYFYDQGDGELGRLMSDFIYWQVIDAKGNAELGLPFWDKKWWIDENSFFSSPTIRSIGAYATTIAITIASGGTGLIAGSIAMTALANSASNILFGALDAALGYKSLGDAAFDIGKSYATNLVSSFSAGKTSDFGKYINNNVSNPFWNVTTHTLATGFQTSISSIATNAINSFTYTGGSFGLSNDIFSSGMKSAMTSTLTSMTSTFTTQSLTAINSGFKLEKLQGFSKLNANDIEKFNNLAGSLAGQGVNYAMGNDFTLNLLDLSLFKNLFNYENDYHSGLLELHLNRNGNTMNFGTDGANISIDNLAAFFRGLNVWDVNSRIGRFIKKENDFDSAIALRNQYGSGDEKQKAQLWEILNGKTLIDTDPNGKVGAESVRDENGKKVITLSGYKQGMSVEDQLIFGVVLGHEAYRDGIVTDNNTEETKIAVQAHTEMALRMIQGGYLSLLNNDNLLKDIVAYNIDGDYFKNYVNNNYDSSGDYWKLLRDGTLVNDNKGWLVDEAGNAILNAEGKQIGAGGIETGLLNILYGGTSGVANSNYTDEQVKFAQKLMSDAGMKYTASDKNNIRTYSWKGNESGQSLNMQNIMNNVGSKVAAPVFARYYEGNAIASVAKTLGKETSALKTNNITKDAFSRFQEKLVPAVLDFYMSMRSFFDPSANMKVSQKHGDNKEIKYNNYEDGKHFGTDFSNKKSGDSIYLGIAGKVVFIGGEKDPYNNNGNWIVVEHGYKFEGSFIGTGIFGEYMHMVKKPDFKIGSYLDSNQIIGTVGNTGKSTGPHLHYSIYTLRPDTFSATSLNMILNNNISDTVTSKNSAYFKGTYDKYMSKKVTYDIENFLNGLKK